MKRGEVRGSLTLRPLSSVTSLKSTEVTSAVITFAAGATSLS